MSLLMSFLEGMKDRHIELIGVIRYTRILRLCSLANMIDKIKGSEALQVNVLCILYVLPVCRLVYLGKIYSSRRLNSSAYRANRLVLDCQTNASKERQSTAYN